MSSRVLTTANQITILRLVFVPIFAILLVAGYRPFYPTILGKSSTVIQSITIFAALCLLARIPGVTESVLRLCVYLAAGITVASGLHYLVVVRNRYSHHASEQV